MLTKKQKALLEEVAKFRKPTREALFSAKARPVSILTKQGKKIIEQLLICDMLRLDKDGDSWSDHACLVFDVLSEKGQATVEAMEQERHERVNGLPMSEWISQNKALPPRDLGTFKEEDIGFWVAEIEKDLYFSNGEIMLIDNPPAHSRIFEKSPDFKPVLRDTEVSRKSIAQVIGFSYNEDIKSDVIWMEAERVIDCDNLSVGEFIRFDGFLHHCHDKVLWIKIRIILPIDSIYYDYVLQQYPKATFGLLGQESSVGIFDNDEFVGVVMPIRYRRVPEGIENLRHGV